ncbi:MAG: adenylate/guanylate cyclase domain-containing protein [Gammaproteobacteria bacterium]|nr:adenylate/guanylate cyclase domain-containing protein [Gammaproteobacteria bacterium]
MTLRADLDEWVRDTIQSQWTVQNTDLIPSAEDLRLNSNHAKAIERATVLYADLDGSTSMVDTLSWQFSAEIYKCFLKCAGDIIKSEGGTITAYDGDRIMAIFTGNAQTTSATRCAMKIHYAVENIIQPYVDRRGTTQYSVNHVVGIDTGELHAARIGVHRDNDLVWIGRAANYAAKLTGMDGKPTRLTAEAYLRLNDSLLTVNGASIWGFDYWSEMGITHYFTHWHHRFD